MPRLSEQELAHRRTGMGSTCIVEACGFAPWKGAGPMRLWNEKMGIVSANDVEEQDDLDDDREWLEWGHIQEPVIADWYEKKRGVSLQLGGPVFAHDVPNFWATLDRTIIGANKLVEIKNVGSPRLYSHWDVSSPEGVPNYVRAQVTIAMRYSGADECDVVASVGGRPPHVWTVFYDAELGEMLHQGGLRFWQLVKDGTPPPLDHTDATRDYLRAKYPREVRGELLEATNEIDVIALERKLAAEYEKSYGNKKRTLDAELMAKLGDAPGFRGEWGSFTWKLNAKGERASRFTPARET